jgi:acid phosphatase (class A)
MKTILWRVVFVYFFLSALSLFGASESSVLYFLNTNSWNFQKIIPRPANKTREEEERDIHFLKDAMAARTKKQLFRALIASSDSIFDYAPIVGPEFNAKQLPYAAQVFKEVESDTDHAIHLAKNTFHRMRPNTCYETKKNETINAGYAYPSGHATRAFVWATLLANLYPPKRKEIDIESRTKGRNRVILGRHYPDDVYGGHYLPLYY